MRSPITEAPQTTTKFGEPRKSRNSGQGQSGSFRYIVLLFLNIGYYASWTHPRSTSISLIVSLRCATGSQILRYVLIAFVFYPAHVLQQDVMSLVWRLTRIAAAKGHLIDISESRCVSNLGRIHLNVIN
jgi:hypothetical protein